MPTLQTGQVSRTGDPTIEEAPVFTHHCSVCEKQHLIFFSQVTSVAATEQGTAVHYTCWCGAAQTWTTAPEGATEALSLVA